MSIVNHEQARIIVSDPEGAAKTLCDLFGWRVISAASAIDGVRSIIVGTEKTCIVLCSAAAIDHVPAEELPSIKSLALTLNHVGIPARNPETLPHGTVGISISWSRARSLTGMAGLSPANREPL